MRKTTGIIDIDNKNGILVPSDILIKNNKIRGTILDILCKVAKKYPNLAALMIKKNNIWTSINYNTYFDKVTNFAESINYWLGDNKNTAILGSNSPGWFYAHLGCMLNKGISIGIYPTSSPESIEFILEHSDAELLVIDGDQLNKLDNDHLHKIKMIVYYSPISEELLHKFKIPVISMSNFMSERKNINTYPSLDDIATLIYTSGTTGNPKGAIITHKNIMSSIYSMMDDIQNNGKLKIRVGERYVSYLPLNHIMAQMMDIYVPICSLGQVWIADKDALKHSLVDTLTNAKPTIFIGVPRVWEKIVEKINDTLIKQGWKGIIAKIFAKNKIINKIGLNNCKLCISGGAPISEYARDYLLNIGIKIYDIYGMTESTGPITLSFNGQIKNNSVGKPLSSLKIKFEKDGEILVKGPTIFEGYYKDNNLSLNSFKNGWFRTGDMGYLDKDGFLHITGRKKEIIITKGGENISPHILENNVIKELPFINYVVIIGDGKKYLTALLVVKTINDNSNKVIQDIKNIDKNIKDISDINKSEILKKLIQNGIDRANKNAPNNANIIQKWRIIPNIFTIGKELTPTLKLKRNYIYEKYKSLINEMYD